QGGPSPHDEILLNTTPHAGAIRVGGWKLIVRAAGSGTEDDVHPVEGAEHPASTGASKVELFDIANDPYEKEDLATSNPEKVSELRRRYDTLARQARPPLSAPKPPGFQSPRVWGESD
ncbi:arylsulfatase, partial [Singulisphaera rosea]